MRAAQRHGANVDPIERAFWRRRTPLDYAARSSADAVKVLLQHGTDLQRRDHDSATPLHHAAGVAKTDVVQLMLEYWPEGQRDKDKYCHTPLHFSARAGNTTVVRHLSDYCPEGLRQKNRDGNTPLHLAAQEGHIDAMSLLAKRWSEGTPGANNQGEKPLSMFLQYGLAEHEDVEEEWDSENPTHFFQYVPSRSRPVEGEVTTGMCGRSQMRRSRVRRRRTRRWIKRRRHSGKRVGEERRCSLWRNWKEG
jgi:hypothetical protein